jgi:hypothetical protein
VNAFTLTLLFLISVSLSAQGTLQFSQVKLVSTQETVPQGKVWKAEGIAGERVILQQFGTNAFNPTRSLILINGLSIDVGQVSGGAGTGAGAGSGTTTTYSTLYLNSPTRFPLWLPEGTTLAAGTNIAYISVIEFNVIP